MPGHDTLDLTRIVCTETGVSAHNAAVFAVIALHDLGGALTSRDVPWARRPPAMIEDARALTGLCAAHLATEGTLGDRDEEAVEHARAAHRATMRSRSFAFYTALAVPAVLSGVEVLDL